MFDGGKFDVWHASLCNSIIYFVASASYFGNSDKEEKSAKTFFRCNPLKGCISRNRIFTHSLTHSLTDSVPLSSFEGFKDSRIEG